MIVNVIHRRIFHHLFLSVAIGTTPFAAADDYFNPNLLTDPSGNNIAVDLSAFEQTSFLPGVYHVDIYINNEYSDTRDVTFKTSSESDDLIPCFPEEQLDTYGIKTDIINKLSREGECIYLNNIEDAVITFDTSKNKVTLAIPQFVFDKEKAERQKEILWDDGITAAFTNYSFSGYHQKNTQQHDTTDSLFLALRSGVNIGTYRYRNDSVRTRNADGSHSWENQRNYLERPLRAIKSTVLAGDDFTDSDIFESLSFRGIKLQSEPQMYPEYMNAYSPVITGVANGDSVVEVSQNGHVIYRTNVPSGPYELTNLVPLGSGSDLYVTQTGIDGGVKQFIVPFSSLDFLQRKDNLKYSLTAGRYRNDYGSDGEHAGGDKSRFFQADAFYGLTGRSTLFGGIQSAARYRAFDLGLGMNIPYAGAVSADVMMTHATPEYTETMDGSAFRLRYSKDFTDTDTRISFAGYQYMSGDYLTLGDMLDNYSGIPDLSAYSRRKNQIELSLTQTLPGSGGSFSGTFTQKNYTTYYQDKSKKTESYNVSYSNTLKQISYSINYAYYKNTELSRDYRSDRYQDHRSNDHVISFNVTVPLSDRFDSIWVTYGATYNKDAAFDNYAGIGASALDNRATWNIQQGYANEGRGYYGSLSGRYRSPYGDINAGYAYRKDTRQFNYGLNGSLVLSRYGVNLSRPLGETNGLVYVPGAAGVGIVNEFGSATDSSGKAVVSNLSPYRNNMVRLNLSSTPGNAEIETSLKEVYPTRGAMVLVDYQTRLGNKFLVTLRDTENHDIPFGAYAVTADSGERFYVSGGGRLYITGVNTTGEMTVYIGDNAQKQCRFTYDLTDKKQINGLYLFEQICR